MNRQRLARIPPLAWLLLLTAACLLPFINKAFHIDDTLFLRAAEQIQKHPADFYGFNINWYGETTPMTKASENPPLTCYYIALVAAIFGWHEWALHLAFLLPALAAVWGIYSLARLYCDQPFLAGFIALVTPVFLISATTLMCDVMLLAFWTWSIVCFERGLSSSAPATPERPREGGSSSSSSSPSCQLFSFSAFQLFLMSGLLAGLAILTKFLAVALVPLLIVYGLCSRRRQSALISSSSPAAPKRPREGGSPTSSRFYPFNLFNSSNSFPGSWLLSPLIPLLFALGYEVVVRSLYGEGWISKAASYSSRAHAVFGIQFLDSAVRGLLFTGGCYLPVLFCAPWLWLFRCSHAPTLPPSHASPLRAPRCNAPTLQRSTAVTIIAVLSLILPFTNTLSGILHDQNGSLNWFLFLQSVLFLASGLHILFLAGADLWDRRDPASVLLLLWVFGIFVFASFVNWTVNGRSLLPMLPAVAILVARRFGLPGRAPAADRASATQAGSGESGRGQPHSTTLRAYREPSASPTGLEVRLSSAALVQQARPDGSNLARPLSCCLPLVISAVLSLLLAKSDYDLANANRLAAQLLCTRYQDPANPLWFEGHWGFQYYMEKLGAKPLDFAYHKLVPGERVVIPAPASLAPALPSDLGKLIESREYKPSVPCSTMTWSGKAGFYTAVFGPLPFYFGTPDPATFSVYEITRPDEKGELQQFINPKSAPEEIARYETRLAAHPDDAQAHFELASLLTRSSRTSEAAAHYREGLRLKPNSPEALNNLAWILATASDADLRDGPEAVQLAERACRLAGEKLASYVGTLAAAYAEAGRFDDAVSAARKAITLAESSGQPELANINRQLLELYTLQTSFSPKGSLRKEISDLQRERLSSTTSSPPTPFQSDQH